MREPFLVCWKRHTPWFTKFEFKKFFSYFYIISTQTSYIYKKPDTNRYFAKLRAISNLFSFFFIHPVVPYIQGVTEPIKRILSNCNIKVALKPYLTLGHIFAKPTGDCEKEYLGQSKRQFGTRLKEHQKSVSTLDKGKSALSEHVCYTKHEIAWENSTTN